MNITVENDVKVIRMGDKGPNLLSVDRAKQIIQELNYDDCKAVIFLGNDKVFSAGLNLKDLTSATKPDQVALIFGTLGVLFNIAYVIQDVHWFVWSTPGSTTGLYSLGIVGNHALWINNIIIWTFQFSQLTHSIFLMLEGLQHDIYLLHVFGVNIYSILLISTLSVLSYLFWRIYKNNSILPKIIRH